ncbi:hypothetical protein [Krasilnikovia sp. MM14-A1259]|uniref:DUF7169 domain-containing protein n=1 Tax=Krasilnikovia sp. MM14-A1259 TaxID=3373539 RepID=UPI0037F9370B
MSFVLERKRDRDESEITSLLGELRAEVTALETLIPLAVDAQWTAAPAARPREDVTVRMKHQKSDPTSDIALDSGRLECRRAVVRSRSVLRAATVAMRGVRRELARAVEPWTGEAL